jgi:membrane-associated phospholipid phosphatase
MSRTKSSTSASASAGPVPPARAGFRLPLRGRVGAIDRKIMARISAIQSPALDAAMPRLSQAANHSVLWLSIAASLALTGSKRARRAAVRGMASVAVASTVSNVIGKGLTGRARPAAAAVPEARRLSHRPHTTSFPSGHAASAAAFATGAALELPVLAVPIGALAAAVGASRVVTGVHYPSDVVAGFAIGVSAGLLTRRPLSRFARRRAA